MFRKCQPSQFTVGIFLIMTSQLLTEHNSNAMCKKPAFLVSLISLITIATLCLLVAFAKLPNSHRNGFTRIFSKNNITPLRRSISKAPYIGFGGTSSTNIFLAVPNPQWLVMLDKNLGKQTNYHIPVPKTDQYSLHSFFVDSPNVFLFANNVPAVVYGTLNGTLTETVKLSTSPFTRCAYISPHSIVIRSFDSTSQNPVFQKVEIQTGRIQKQVGLFKASGDFGLSTDGFLLYDSLTRSIIYVEYFTNKVVCIDTNLNLPHASQTIDTTNYNAVTIKDVKFEDGNRLMPVTARTTINSDGCVFK